MAHDHSHNHSHSSGKNLKVAFFLNLGFTILEILGGLYVNSVAILSDALHDLGDSLSLGLSWYLNERSKKEANNKFTFGYGRFSLLGALINSVVLIVGSIYIIIAAIERLITPEPADAKGMFIFAIIGIIVNGYAAYKLSGGKTLNERVVSLHLVEDVLGWVAVLIASVVMMFVDAPYLDPALSLAITLYILYNVVKRLKETMMIMLQGTPDDIDPDKIEKEILQVENITSLHHMHIWSLEGEHHVFTVHIKVNGTASFKEVLAVKSNVKAILKNYSFSHYTIEVELGEEVCELESC
ncbi:MAG: cation transporter [Flavobacterium sp. MedPE-SWcel]|uniref:cation diffusion facilitator family transporter n=1 Tax=uncultured Flavobacterium sp. TaxID=165435 RepID=UPI000920D02A|nr:cation diffusion facilitator family transporter [uncultured Flavobacterium sp.]OIQ22539.1 MAG: cation transporter [Flavobacterium sp. MedPE-SWcel]